MQICTPEWDFLHHFHDKSRLDYTNRTAIRQFISRWLLLGLKKKGGGFFLLPSKPKWSDNYLAIWPTLFDNNYSSFCRSSTNSGQWILHFNPTTAGWGIISTLSGRKTGSEGQGVGAAPGARLGVFSRFQKSSAKSRGIRVLEKNPTSQTQKIKREGRERLWVLARLSDTWLGKKKKKSVPSATLLRDINLLWLVVKRSFQVAGAGWGWHRLLPPPTLTQSLLTLFFLWWWGIVIYF